MTRTQLEKLTDAELRKALATARKNRGYKMREMAALLGLSVSAYSFTESETRPLMRHKRERLIEFLEGENLTAPEREDVRAVRVIDSALASLTKREKKRVVSFLVEKLKE